MLGITGIHWYCSGLNTVVRAAANSTLDADVPGTLCITFDNGKIQLSHGDDDNTAEIIDTGLSSVSFCRWTTKGNILAVVGTMSSTAQQAVGAGSKGDLSPKGGVPGAGTNIVKFFDAYGKLLRNIRIPGENISAVSWEGGDLRLSLAVDSYIYFANIRHSYLWAYFLNSVVYSYPKPDRREVHQHLSVAL